MQKKRTLWIITALLYAAFCAWYTDLRGALDEDDIAHFLEALQEVDLPPESVESLHTFMKEDSGRQFFMLNAVHLAETPESPPGAAPGQSAQELLDHYMEHMTAELFKRASHPTIVGPAVHNAVDVVGLEDVRDWSFGALMRYRSRRDFMEIVSMPETHERHEFKVAALEKTIAYPIEAELNLGDPRLLLGLVLFGVVGTLQHLRMRKQLEELVAKTV